MISTRPLTDLVIEHIGTLVLRTIRFICKVTDQDSAIVVPLTRALVSVRITARPLIEHIGAFVLVIGIVGDRRLAAESLSPAV